MKFTDMAKIREALKVISLPEILIKFKDDPRADFDYTEEELKGIHAGFIDVVEITFTSKEVFK